MKKIARLLCVLLTISFLVACSSGNEKEVNVEKSKKTFIDRLYPIYNSLNIKEIIVIATCYNNNKKFIDDVKSRK